MLRPRLRIPRVSSLLRRPATQIPIPIPNQIQIQIQSPFQFRSYHEAPPRLEQFQDPDEGVPGLLSPEGFHLAWTEYMEFTISKLNALTNGTEFEFKETHQIVKETARQPGQAPTFNYASMAYNHHFFFLQLARLRPAEAGRPVEEVGLAPVAMPSGLRHELARQFGTTETLRREMIATADAMFGPGFVWLVKLARSRDYRVLPTYLAGTPFVAAHWRRQGLDLNTRGLEPAPGADGYSVDEAARQFLERGQVGAGAGPDVGRFDRDAPTPGGTEVIPLLCLSTWQHVYLRDWGVANKRAYMEAWWDCVDWRKVEALALGSADVK